MARVIISGEPGTTWVNETGSMRYQFVATLINTCGFCLQYHLKISSAWPIPMHHGCRCVQLPIPPGGDAPHEFVDFRMLLEKMPTSEKTTAIGVANYKLLKAGLVTWAEVVTAHRVRDLAEVVALSKLTLKQLLAARVRKQDAEAAVATSHATAEEHGARRDREQEEALAAPQRSLSALILALSATVPALVTGTVAAAVVTGHAGELAKAIKAWRPKRRESNSAK